MILHKPYKPTRKTSLVNRDEPDHRSWPSVHKETENEDQAQDQTYQLQLLVIKSCKFDEIFTILSGG